VAARAAAVTPEGTVVMAAAGTELLLPLLVLPMQLELPPDTQPRRTSQTTVRALWQQWTATRT